jgi:hypothetical protein
MAALPNSNPTLADWSKEVDPKGKTPVIVNLLSQTNEITIDATFLPGNLPTGHRVTVDTGLPGVTKRAINEGVLPTAGHSSQFDEAFSMFEAFSEVDAALVKLNGNNSGYRMNQARRFMESMNQDVAQSVLYGNPADDPKDFLGLAPRMNEYTNGGNSANVLHAGGDTADVQTSIYLVVWGPGSVFMGFPEGSAGGLYHEDHGLKTAYDVGAVAGTRMMVYEDWFKWDTGLVVEDWRSCVRICNIEVSDLQALIDTQAPAVTAAGTNIINRMEEALYRPTNKSGRYVFYMNRSTHAGLSRMAMEKNSAAVTVETGLSQFGTPMRWTAFMGVPIRQVDRILNTEALVPA